MPTIYDVAQRAGVSPKTVSRVLNHDAAVKTSTRHIVEQAMQELGYIPSSAARLMRSQRSGLIGVITRVASNNIEKSTVRGLPDMFLVDGAQKIAAQAGKTLMVANANSQSERVAELMRQFLQYRAEGIIYVSEFHQTIQLPIPNECPVVLLNCFDDAHTPAIVPDDEHGQYQLVKQLIAHGHRRIAYITLPEHIIATQLRLAGYKAALAEYGIEFDEQLIATGYVDRTNNINDLWLALQKVLHHAHPPTVLCCGNDEMAMRVYGMLRTRGIKVPEDISVAGFDNHEQIAETLFPTLTTASLPYAAMGEQAMKLLLKKINGQDAVPSDYPCKIAGHIAWRDSVIAQ